jgi:carbamoyltransferase
MGTRVNIIGISCGYHDSACCLLQNGKLLAAAQEERFSRIKNDKSFPGAALRYCLDHAALTIADIDCVAFYEDPAQKLSRQLWMGMLPGSTQDRRDSIRRRALATLPQEAIRLIAGYEGPIEIVDHHLSHAASAYFFSGFDEAAILTVDGVGEWPTTTYNSAEDAEINRLEQVDFPDSLGLFYSAITGYLGFEVNEGEYKVMGLAPYGQPIFVDKIQQLIEDGQGGQYRLRCVVASPGPSFSTRGGSGRWARAECQRLSMADEIEIGSIVRLKSGGPNMTVEAIFSDHDGAWVRCSWSDDTKRISRTFDLDAVELLDVAS